MAAADLYRGRPVVSAASADAFSARRYVPLVENVAGGGPGAPEGFEIDAYNARKVAELADEPVELLLEQFGQQRARMTALVAGLEAGKLECRGRHPFLGIVPLSEIIRLVYRHNQLHLRDVKRVLTV
jgi:hypothetical protein